MSHEEIREERERQQYVFSIAKKAMTDQMHKWGFKEDQIIWKHVFTGFERAGADDMVSNVIRKPELLNSFLEKETPDVSFVENRENVERLSNANFFSPLYPVRFSERVKDEKGVDRVAADIVDNIKYYIAQVGAAAVFEAISKESPEQSLKSISSQIGASTSVKGK